MTETQEVGLHQGSKLSSFLFAVVMDRLTDGIRCESPRTVQCCLLTAEMERWRYALERRKMEVAYWSNTKVPLCVNGDDGGGSLRLQGGEVESLGPEIFINT